MKILFIGGGNMAQALIGGMLGSEHKPNSISVCDPSPEAQNAVREKFNIDAISEVPPGANMETVVLAVKPKDAREAVISLGESDFTLISVAAGIGIKTLSNWRKKGKGGIVRAMPNTPSLVGLGFTGLFAADGTEEQDREIAAKIFSTVGKVAWMPDEEILNTVTAISGSGPAYFHFFTEALEKAAIELGMSPELARTAAIQTGLGALTMSATKDADPAALRRAVTSKKGTTERG